MRVSPEEKQWWEAAARERGLSLSSWIATVCNEEVKNVSSVSLEKAEVGDNDHHDSQV
jgi:hypothetical protein